MFFSNFCLTSYQHQPLRKLCCGCGTSSSDVIWHWRRLLYPSRHLEEICRQCWSWTSSRDHILKVLSWTFVHFDSFSTGTWTYSDLDLFPSTLDSHPNIKDIEEISLYGSKIKGVSMTFNDVSQLSNIDVQWNSAQSENWLKFFVYQPCFSLHINKVRLFEINVEWF